MGSVGVICICLISESARVLCRCRYRYWYRVATVSLSRLRLAAGTRGEAPLPCFATALSTAFALLCTTRPSVPCRDRLPSWPSLACTAHLHPTTRTCSRYVHWAHECAFRCLCVCLCACARLVRLKTVRLRTVRCARNHEQHSTAAKC